MSKVSCSICGKIHDRNYMCEAKRVIQIERNKGKNNRKDSRLYNTTRWKKLRDNILQEYNSIDLFNYYVFGKVSVADNVHHITEICEDESLAYDWDNLMPLGERTHRKIVHKLYDYNFELKKELKSMLIDMLKDWNEGKKELRSYNKRFNLLLNKYNCKSLFST